MKKTLLPLGLLAAVGANELQASELLFNVSHEIHQEANAIFSQKKNSVQAQFEKLDELAQRLDELNNWISQKPCFSQSELGVLRIIDAVLDFTFQHFKSQHEEAIYAAYMQDFRFFSSVHLAFKAHLKQIDEALNGIQIVRLDGISLSPEDLELITKHAKSFEEKILNVG